LAATALTAVGIAAAVGGWWSSGIGEYAWDIVWHLILPMLELTLISFGGTMLLMRDSMLEVVREDYVTTAKAKGLPDKVVRDKHAARTALMPVVTSFTLSIGFILSGGIITETMFSWEGMGLTYFTAMLANDYPLAMGCLVFTGVLALVAHLVADLLYAFLDPRITY
jgi:peptide/nickel transport system permease protein